MVVVVLAASAALVWGLAAEEEGFRPTAVAALSIAAATVASALMWPLKASTILIVLSLAAAGPLLAVPVGQTCDTPVVAFVRHTFEDTTRPHIHDRCQLESDRRSMAALVLAAGGGAAVVLLISRSRKALR